MTGHTVVIVYSTENTASADAITEQLTQMIDGWPEDVSVRGATITDDTGNVIGLPVDAAAPAPANQDAPSQTEAQTAEAQTTGTDDPNTDPTESVPTGREF